MPRKRVAQDSLVTMHTFFGTPEPDPRPRRRPRRHAFGRGPQPPEPRSPAPAPQGTDAGFLLVEVIISTLLVGMIVIATLTGFDVVNRSTIDNRQHNEAAVLAAQSQEQLRTDPASALDALESSSHKYTKTVGGTIYTITQEAKSVSGSGEHTGCSVTESSAQSGANVQITSLVTWKQLEATKRPPVKASSIVTPPTGSALEVDVGNHPAPTAGVSGVTVLVTYTPVESKTPLTLEGTTGPPGCLVFGGIQSTTAAVAIQERTGFVTINGTLKYPTKEITIAPNITVHDSVIFNQGGAIEAQYTYKELTEYNGKQVKSDTFVVSNNQMGIPPPELEGGSTSVTCEAGGEEHYTTVASTYKPNASTAACVKYPRGDLFPFAAGSATWEVYAGDCNNKYIKTIEQFTPVEAVLPGASVTAKVKMSLTELSAWTGNASGEKRGELDKEPFPAKITSAECEAAAVPNNAAARTFVHEQVLSGGHLENPFQPFGAFKLCVFNKAAGKTYTAGYINSVVAGSTPQIYIGQKSGAEQLKQQTEETAAKEKAEKEEKTAKEKKEKEEAPAREKREGEEKAQKKAGEEETAARVKREAEEASARKEWKELKDKGKKITAKQREEKEVAQTANAKKLKEAEEAAKAKREGEEKATTKTREKEEAAKTKREGEEKLTETARTTKEAETAAKRKAQEAEEAANGVVVESGKLSC